MSKSIIVTEKPSVAMEFAKTLGVHNRNDGYIENDNYIITWCVGHLVTLSYPEVYDDSLKKWSLDTLPFLPKNYKYEVIDNVKKQFNVIKKIYHRNDVSRIYYAGDPAREGLYIQMLVRQQAGIKEGIDEKVIWIDSQTEDEIRRGIKEAKPLSAYKDMADSGYMRAIEDYALGINISRALSLRYGRILNPDSNVPIAVGRVMSCVLGMVTKREYEIINFKPEQFYKIDSKITVGDMDVIGSWKVDEQSKYYNSSSLYNDTGFKTKNDAEDFIHSLSKEMVIEKAEITEERKSAPLLYNLAELQAECSKQLKISPDETLKIAQELYEKKLTTYPRTNSRVLSSAIAKEIRRNVSGLSNINELRKYVEKILSSGNVENIINTRYTDDSKVEDHYAIIPTGQCLNEISSLTETSQKVFMMIAKRFLAIFCPQATYKKYTIVGKDKTERFYSSGKTLCKKGYLMLYGVELGEEFNPEIENIKTGQTYSSKYRIHDGETQPPKRYTSGSMVLAMENAGQLIEDEELRAQIKGSGIGTSATRAETIKKLVRIGYLKLNTKTQVLTPDSMGFMVYELLQMTIPSLLNPKMTANWEKGLSKVESGEIPVSKYREKLEGFIQDEVARIKATSIREELEPRIASYQGKGKAAKPKVNAECYLLVPYEEKDEVKKLGAFFDTEKGAWYVPKGKDTTPFKKWITDKVPTKKKKILLDVPYEDREKVKALGGARWDGEKKTWYTTSDNKEKFKKWLKTKK